MKRLYLIILMIVAVMAPAAAQKPGCKNCSDMVREIQEFKIKFLAQEMELTEAEKKEFVPLYQSMEEEKADLYRDLKAHEKALKDKKNAKEADYEKMSHKITEAKAKDAAIEKKYDRKFSKFLSPKKIFRMKEAEDQFRRKLHQMRKEKQGDRKHCKQSK